MCLCSRIKSLYHKRYVRSIILESVKTALSEGENSVESQEILTVESPNEKVSQENSSPRDPIARSKAMENFSRQMLMDLDQAIDASKK
jgi:hypothetical protein